MNKLIKHKLLRKEAQKELGSYGSLKLTWSRFDCGIDEEGLEMACTKCIVCKHNDFLDFANSVGKPEGTEIENNAFIDSYTKTVYDY